jgi:hypothetical protein
MKKFLTIEKIKTLEEGFNWLSEYKTPKEDVHHIGPNVNTEDVYETKLLRELGKINVRKEQIITELLK